MEALCDKFPFRMEKIILKEIALDQRKRFDERSRGIGREILDSASRHLKKPHTVVITGIRRCGKSTLLAQIADKNFNKNDYYYFNFEDERLVDFSSKDFSLLHEVLIECFGEHRIFFLDEVQNVENWEGFVRRMQDSGYKFILTGSNASLLSYELGTKLTGRHVDVKLTPFSFREFSQHCKEEITEEKFLSPSGRAKVNKLFESYRLKGGFPEYLEYDDPEILTQLYEDILYRDVAKRHEIKNTKVLRELALYYMSNVSALCSYNKLKEPLGVGSVTTISSYTENLEKSFLISSVGVFDFSVKRQMIAPKKIYAADTGLANSVSLSFSKNIGPLTENLVYIELNRRGHDIAYCKMASGSQVDFVCYKGKKILELIQVCSSISERDTKKREVNSLLEAMDEFEVKEGKIIAEAKKEEIIINKKRIIIVPIAEWLSQPL